MHCIKGWKSRQGDGVGIKSAGEERRDETRGWHGRREIDRGVNASGSTEWQLRTSVTPRGNATSLRVICVIAHSGMASHLTPFYSRSLPRIFCVCYWMASGDMRGSGGGDGGGGRSELNGRGGVAVGGWRLRVILALV